LGGCEVPLTRGEFNFLFGQRFFLDLYLLEILVLERFFVLVLQLHFNTVVARSSAHISTGENGSVGVNFWSLDTFLSSRFLLDGCKIVLAWTKA
jgi:hypothetical protein